MTIDEAIQHCKEQVQEQAKKGCYSCAEEHQQLAEWLKELKAYREHSGDAISRQAIEEIKEIMTDISGNSVYVVRMSDIRTLPSVTPQQRTGRWILHPNGIYAHLICDKCLSCAPYGCKINYCPSCGAKMEVEE